MSVVPKTIDLTLVRESKTPETVEFTVKNCYAFIRIFGLKVFQINILFYVWRLINSLT